MTLIASDNFDRANQSGWGTASGGGTWSVVSGSATLAISSNEGIANGVSAQTFIRLGSVTSENAEALVKLAVPSVNYVAIGIFLRSTAGNTAYRFRLNSNNSSQGIGIVKTVAGSSTNLATSSFTVSLNTLYWIRARIEGLDLFMKAWQDGSSEPGPWTLTTSDSEITGPGGFGVVVNTPQTADSARFDDFSVFDFNAVYDLSSRARIMQSVLYDLSSRVRLLNRQPLGQDNFTRANQSGFGVASDGQTWEYLAGDQASSITGNAGQITSGAGTATFLLGTRTARDVDITIRVKSSADGDHMGIAARLTDETTHYRIFWSDEFLRVVRDLADIKTTLATSAFSIDGAGHDDFYWIRTQIFGSSPTTLRAKIWLDGTSEPGAWAIDVSDTNPLNFAGRHGLHLSTGISANIVAINSYTAYDLSLPRDLVGRARISSQALYDLTAYARIGGFPVDYDLSARAHIAGLGLGDLTARANLANAAVPPPAYQPGTLSVLVGGVTYPIKADSLSINESLDGRSTCDFTIIDLPGTLHIQHRQRVEITHSVRGVLFRGFINSANEVNLLPNATNEVRITCIDEHYLADKRAYFGDEYSNQYAGAIAVDLARILTEEGLTANFVADRDSNVIDFSQGTLSNVTASDVVEDGALELAPAGSVISIEELGSNEFLNGILDGAEVNANGALTLASEPALRLTADCTVPGGGDLYTYQRFYFGNNLIASGDQLQYEVWIASNSPQIKAAIDFLCSDGTQLAKSTPTDQIGLDATPDADLAGFADDRWYARSISLNSLAGKTIQHVSVAFGGDEVGAYTAYFRRVRLVDNSDNVKQEFYNGLPITSWGGMANNGYTNILLRTVQAYEKQGSRISPTSPLTGAGIARNSIIAWTAQVPENIELAIDASLDQGATWQRCENFSAIPGLVPGLSLAGRSLLIRETITNNSPDPTGSAALSSLSATVQPSWNGTKQDRVINASNDTDWLAGTISGLIVSDGTLTLNQKVYDWDDGLVDINAYGTNSPGADGSTRQLVLSTGATSDVRHRLDGAGEWQNFIAEIDVKIPENGAVGLVYRTPFANWQNNNHTYAYSAHVSTSLIALSRGTNSAIGAGSETVLDTAVVTLDADAWHRLKVVVNGNNHEVFLDEVSYCFAVDATHSAAGSFGARYNNTSGSPATATLDNFGVVDTLSGTWTSPAFDLTSVQAVQDTFVAWSATTPESANVVIEASINGGASFFDCENGAAISILERGTITDGMSLQISATLISGNASVAPVLSALSATVVGMLGAFGHRIGPPLSLDALGTRCGSSQISWNAQLAGEETVLNVEVSLNAVNWFDVTEDNGEAISLIFSQTEPFIESFDKQSTDYTSTHLAEGEDAIWSIDVAQSRIVAAGGIEALYRYDPLFDFIDGEIFFDTDRLDNGGLIWKLNEEATQCYMITVSDDLGMNPAGMLRLYKVISGMKTQQGLSAQINFVRGVPTRFRISQDVWDITISVDGREILSYHDNDPLGEGFIALRSSGGTQQYSQLRIVEYGDDLSSQNLYTRTRLSSTDPRFSPQLTDLSVAVYGPSIAPGALIPATTYSVVSGSENNIAQNLDDLASQSEYWWRIKNSVLYFQPRSGIPAPFIVTGRDMLAESKVAVTRIADLYRNEQVVIGGTDFESRAEKRIADGFRAGFDTDVPVESISRLQINGQDVSFGILGVDVDKAWYFQRGEKGIVQAEGTTLLADGQEIVISYRGIIDVVVSARRDGQIVILSAQDETSGIVTVVEKADGLGVDAATELALSRLRQYAKLSVDLSFTTMRPGLASGQLLTVFLDQHGLRDETFLITSVDYAPSPRGASDLYEYFAVKATSGAILGDWTKLFS